MDTTPDVERIQVSLLQQISVAKRIALTSSLTQTTVQLARQAISKLNPDKSEFEKILLFMANHYGIELTQRIRENGRGSNKMKTPEILDAIRPVIRALESLGISYYVGGSLASSAYGIARATLDVDIVADLKQKNVIPVANLLKSNYYLEKKMISQAIQKGSFFNLIHQHTMLKIDIFILKPRAYDKEAFSRKRKENLDVEQKSLEVYLASPEDIILSKLEWYRMGNEVSERQWNDVLGVLKVQKNHLYLKYLQHWARELRILDLLDRALKDAGF